MFEKSFERLRKLVGLRETEPQIHKDFTLIRNGLAWNNRPHEVDRYGLSAHFKFSDVSLLDHCPYTAGIRRTQNPDPAQSFQYEGIAYAGNMAVENMFPQWLERFQVEVINDPRKKARTPNETAEKSIK